MSHSPLVRTLHDRHGEALLELELSSRRYYDEMDDKTLSALIRKYDIVMEHIVPMCPKIWQWKDPILDSFLDIIFQEMTHNPTCEANMRGAIIVPSGELDDDENSIFQLYRVHFPYCDARHALWIRRGPIHDSSELELSEHISDTRLNETKTHFNPEYWTSARVWLRHHYGGQGARQKALEKYQNQTGIPFRLMDLPIEIRLMIYEFLVGEQIWPHSDPELHAHVEQSHEAAVAKFSAKSWTDGINTGVYPISFAKVQRKKRHFKRADRSVENETSPEDSHVGLGPTRDVQAAAMNLMRANREVRREVAKAVWGKSIKRFNRLRVLNDTVYYLRRYCTRQELPGHSFPPRDPLVLQRVSLSLSNEEYLHFVGYEFDDRRIVRRDAEGGLKMLAGIHTLQHLNLQFQIFEPSLQPLPGEGDYWEYRTDCWTPLDGLTCQKELVNIILTLGYDLLKRIEKVTISGHVKRSAHEKWDPLLRGEAYIKASGKKGDMAADVAEILATPDSTYPPKCECESPCEWWRFRDEDGEFHKIVHHEFSYED